MREILRQNAEELVDKLGPSIGRCDFTCTPVYPEKRWDVCVVRRTSRDDSYGFDTVYLLWLGKGNNLLSKLLTDSRETGDYLDIDDVSEEAEHIIVWISVSRYGKRWNEEFRIAKAELGLE